MALDGSTTLESKPWMGNHTRLNLAGSPFICFRSSQNQLQKILFSVVDGFIANCIACVDNTAISEEPVIKVKLNTLAPEEEYKVGRLLK